MFVPAARFLRYVQKSDQPIPSAALSNSTTSVIKGPCALRIKSSKRLLCMSSMLALLLILSIATGAQRLPMRLYTTEDGLWSGFINTMMRDSRGFLWFCTRDGLSRFDGYRFTNYKIAGVPSSQNFTYIFESRDGIFWIVLSDSYLYRYDPGSATSAAQAQTGQSDDGRVLLHAELVRSEFLP